MVAHQLDSLLYFRPDSAASSSSSSSSSSSAGHRLSSSLRALKPDFDEKLDAALSAPVLQAAFNALVKNIRELSASNELPLSILSIQHAHSGVGISIDRVTLCCARFAAAFYQSAPFPPAPIDIRSLSSDDVAHSLDPIEGATPLYSTRPPSSCCQAQLQLHWLALQLYCSSRAAASGRMTSWPFRASNPLSTSASRMRTRPSSASKPSSRALSRLSFWRR